MSLTIPAACLIELGAMQPGDGGVRVCSSFGARSSWVTWYDAGTIANGMPFGEEARIDVVESAPALERVLARHLGYLDDDDLRLRTIHRGESPRQWVVRAYCTHDEQPRWSQWLPEHISADLDRLEALAEAVVHYARVERARKVFESCDFPEDHEVTGHPGPPSPDYIEKNFDLTTWAVQR